MGNKLYVTQVPTQTLKSTQTVICQVKISRAAMKAAQGAAKLQSTTKERKNNIFSTHQKHQFQYWCFFFACIFLIICFIENLP
jgi:hypothetical protein